MRIAAKTFKKLATFMGRNTSRPHMCGVAIDLSNADCINLVATDDFILCKIIMPHDKNSYRPNTKVIIFEAKDVKNIIRAGDGVLTVNPDNYTAEYIGNTGANFSLVGKDFDYPNYERAIPKDCVNSVAVNRQGLLDAIKSIQEEVKIYNIGKDKDSIIPKEFLIELDFISQLATISGKNVENLKISPRPLQCEIMTGSVSAERFNIVLLQKLLNAFTKPKIILSAKGTPAVKIFDSVRPFVSTDEDTTVVVAGRARVTPSRV